MRIRHTIGHPTRRALAVAAMGLALVAGACAPTTGGGTTTTTTPPVTTPATYKDGRCTGTEGVTIVVDFMPFQDVVVVRCALGPQTSGFAVLAHAGFTTDPGRYPGTVCQLDGFPIQGHPFCWTTGGYWAYWKSTTAGGPWVFSEWGAGAGPSPAPGAVEGWKFGLFSAGAATPPRIGTTGPVVP